LKPATYALEQHAGSIALLRQEAQSSKDEDPTLEHRDEATDDPDDDQEGAYRKAGDA
jgi:hypothetical protein